MFFFPEGGSGGFRSGPRHGLGIRFRRENLKVVISHGSEVREGRAWRIDTGDRQPLRLPPEKRRHSVPVDSGY